MTLKEAMQTTVEILQSINVPVGLIPQIGDPIAVAIGNLNACIDGINKMEEQENGHNADSE